MKDTIIHKHIRRCNRNLIIINFGIIILLIYFVLNNYLLNKTNRYYYHFQRMDYFFIFAGIIVFIICFINLIKAKKRISNPYLHPISISLTDKYGSVEEIAIEIDSDLQDKNSSLKLSSIQNLQIVSAQITNSWLLKPSFFGLTVLNLYFDAVWIYKKVTTHYTNFIPTGRSYTVIIHSRYLEVIEIPCRSKKSDIIIQEIIYRVPWIVQGFDEGVKLLWDSNPLKLIDDVDKQRKSILSKTFHENHNDDKFIINNMNETSMILDKYLGKIPDTIDLRKKALLEDNIDLLQWQINMNYLINYFEKIMRISYVDLSADKNIQKVTPVLLNLQAINLPPILLESIERNWFISAYPDVLDYFYPQYYFNTLSVAKYHKNQGFIDDPSSFIKEALENNEESDASIKQEISRVQQHLENIKKDYELLKNYLAESLKNLDDDLLVLLKIKDFYKNHLHKKFLLANKSKSRGRLTQAAIY